MEGANNQEPVRFRGGLRKNSAPALVYSYHFEQNRHVHIPDMFLQTSDELICCGPPWFLSSTTHQDFPHSPPLSQPAIDQLRQKSPNPWIRPSSLWMIQFPSHCIQARTQRVPSPCVLVLWRHHSRFHPLFDSEEIPQGGQYRNNLETCHSLLNLAARENIRCKVDKARQHDNI